MGLARRGLAQFLDKAEPERVFLMVEARADLSANSDRCAWFSNLALEHLATSDRGIVMIRRLLRGAIKAIEKAQDPPGTYRDLTNRIMKNPARNGILPAKS